MNWKHISEKLYKYSVVLSIIGIVASFGSAVIQIGYKKYFVWLFLYMPLLWSLWVACVFVLRSERSFWKLIALWFGINIGVLMLFVSSAVSFNSWARSSGIDVGLLIVYFPISVPLFLLLDYVPMSIRSFVFHEYRPIISCFGDGIGSAVVLWVNMSVVAVSESAIILYVSRWRSKVVG